MTPQQKDLVRATWPYLTPISQTTAAFFYSRLFGAYPEVQAYFNCDMAAQRRKLMAMLDVAVQSLDELEALIEPLRDSGARHASYGVRDDDYDKVAEALLLTLETGLGETYTREVQDAWVALYTVVASVMKTGASAPAPIPDLATASV